MAINSCSRMHEEEQFIMNDAQENNPQAYQDDSSDDDKFAEPPSVPDDEYPIRIHDPDIENVVGMGYD